MIFHSYVNVYQRVSQFCRDQPLEVVDLWNIFGVMNIPIIRKNWGYLHLEMGFEPNEGGLELKSVPLILNIPPKNMV